MKAVRVSQAGGPEVLHYEEVPDPQPGAGEVLVKIEAIGLNYIDTYHRTGLYPLDLPFIPGLEAAGTVKTVGADVKYLQVDDRVAYSGVPASYAEYVAAPEARLVKLPEGVDTQTGAAAMLQGMTAHYLAHGTYPLKRGDTALIHAAAGGVGLLLVQMAKACGARVFGTVSTDEKSRLARDAGADEIIRYTEQDFEAEVKRLTHGRGVDVVYDSVARTTFEKGLNCLRPRGLLVLFGQSSGPVPPFDPGVLNAKGSLYLTRPTLKDYTAARDELLQRAGDVLGWVQSGQLKLRIDRTLPLPAAAEAHRLIEGRKTAGKVLLIP